MSARPEGTEPRRVLEALFADTPEGSIPFEQFMRAALYDPEVGYYTARVREIGTRGDFATSSTIEPFMARAAALWFGRVSRDFRGGFRHFIELGGGNGTFAREFLRSIPLSLRLRTRYHLVEISPSLRTTQRQQIQGYGIRWHETVKEALDAAGGVACIFSNEFVDAFPCRLLEWSGGRWAEIRIIKGGDGLDWSAVPLGDAVPSGFSALSEPSLQREGQRVELHGSYRTWLAQELVPHWHAGRMITIDYGGEAGTIYQRRPLGSLRGYYRHQRREGTEVLRQFSFQDLTADVNFTDLRNWGEELGIHTVRLLTQADFLRAELDRGFPPNASSSDPLGAGEAFKVLDQERGG
jgi:SAM-dependent MidA family methyltransferase